MIAVRPFLLRDLHFPPFQGSSAAGALARNLLVTQSMNALESLPYPDLCHRLLGMELAASDTYTEALHHFHDDPEQSLLLALRAGHDENIDCLTDHLTALGEQVNSNAQPEGTFQGAVDAISMTFGESATFMALEAGEAALIKDYSETLLNEALPAPLREDLMGRLIPRLERHVAELEKIRSSDGVDVPP